jgi:APA family basic amino acid/polyamine antiporter
MEKTQANNDNGKSLLTFGGLFRVKPLDVILQNADEPEHQLKRALGPVQLTLFGVGAIIGAGIFTTVGTAAAGEAGIRAGAGPALVVSFVITAIACAFTALCYAEFAAMVPISGSAYTYSYATLGELIAWIIGWDLIIEYAVGNIAVAIGWAQYFRTFIEGFSIRGHQLHIPDWLVNNYRTATPEVMASAPRIFGVPIVFNLLAVLIVALVTVVLVWGIKESARFNAIMVGFKILVLAFFIIVGFAWTKPANWTPFAPNGWAGVSAGAAIIFFAFIGFDAVSTVAEETENPQRNLPVGIIASLIVCTILYIAVAAVFTGMIPYSVLVATPKAELAEPLTLALKYVQSHGASANSNLVIGVVAFGSVVAATAVLLVFQLGQPRIFLSMARDGLLPGLFRKVHPKYRTPHVSTILTGVFVAFFAAIASIDEVVDLTNIGTLFAFILVCAGIIVLRVKEPERPRPFRAPGGLVLPVLGIISCVYLIYYLPPTSWLRFAAWLNFGFVIYVGYGSMKSVLTGKHTTESHADHEAHTAYTGTWLLIAGTALLVFMRAFDVWLVATKWTAAMQDAAANADAIESLGTAEPWLKALGAGSGSPLANVFTLAPWRELSFFLIVPLALNAFLLCPIIIKRALSARRDGARGQFAGKTGICIAVAVIFAIVSIAYLWMVVFRHN